jgi:ABC-type phosphonate transport system ATPase subunit
VTLHTEGGTGGGLPDVEVREATKSFGPVTAVDRVSFAVSRGEFYSLLGPSGCGKTTTLRLEALGESVSAFACIGGSGTLVRVADRRRLVHPRRKWEDVLLTPPGARRLQVILSTIEPGAGRVPNRTPTSPTRSA